MTSAEHHAYNGGPGQSSQRGPGGQSPPEAENLLAFGCPVEAANLPHALYFANYLNPRYLCKGAGTNMKVVGHVSIRRKAPEKFFYRAPPLFIQCPPKWRGTAQCNVLSFQPSTVHRPRGYKVCKLSHCDELIYVIMEVDYKLCKAQRQTTRHH